MFPLGIWVTLTKRNTHTHWTEVMTIVRSAGSFIADFTHPKLWSQPPLSWQFPACWKQSICIFPETGQNACCEAWTFQFCCWFLLLGCLETQRVGHPLSTCICWSEVCNKSCLVSCVLLNLIRIFLNLMLILCHLLRWWIASGFTSDSESVVKRKCNNRTRCLIYYSRRLLHCNIKTDKHTKL